MNIPLIKFITFEGSRLWLIPSNEGLEFYEYGKPIMTSDRGLKYPLVEDTCIIGGAKVKCYLIDFKESILNVSHNTNLPANQVTLRIYTSDQDNKYLVHSYSKNQPSYTPVPI